ncbi:MAG: hypothetical protein ACE5E1_08890 [Phycisphaerae bacterium]
MEESVGIPEASDAPADASDSDVSRLLDEADSLSKEITADIGATSPVQDSEAVPPVGESAVDPIEATARVEEDVRQLNDLLHDPDSDRAADSPDTQAEADDIDDEAPLEADEPGETVEDAAADPAVSAETRAADAVDSEEASDSADRAAEEPSDGTPPREEEEGEAAEESAPASEDEAEPAPAPPARRSVAAVMRSALRAGVGVPRFAFRTVGRLAILFDTPFTWVSPAAKRVIGYLALATLLTGAASWVLPALLNGNPFADMTPTIEVGGP